MSTRLSRGERLFSLSLAVLMCATVAYVTLAFLTHLLLAGS